MKTVKEWFSCQLLTKSLNLVRPFSFMNQESSDQELETYDSAGVASISPPPVSVDISTNSSLMNRENGSSPPPQPVPVEDSHLFDDKSLDPLIKVEALQIKFLRLIQQIRQSPENIVVAQALDRLQLASLIRAGELDKRPASLTLNKARVIAVAKEAVGQRDMDFSIKILVLGRTGVGKSATINSIFNQTVVLTDAFQPATERIQEVVGTVSGIKITFIDTPGLSPAYSNQRRNRKIMLSVKRHIRRSPPDIVLYFERLDVLNMGYSDFSLLKLVNDVFGSAIWFNTIIVMTHSSSALPEGPDGSPVRYETFVNQSTSLVQHYILQVASDTDLDIPVLLVDNHPFCKTNFEGEKVLPNGQVWKSQFLLLCIVTKVLGDANILLKFQDTFQAKQHRTRSPSLPHLLSSLLKPRSFPASVASGEELQELSDIDGEDDYNQLPPIMILTKRQFERLTKDQKKAYLDELDYRETLYMKKQWKEELRRCRDSSLSNGNDGNEDDASSDMVLYDLPIPESFHSDCPEHRYRCLITNDRSLVRPVLDSQGWDHDVGYDGISVEASTDMKRNLSASISGQMRKDKQDFSIQTECLAAYKHSDRPSILAGVDVQTAGRDLICTLHGDAKLRNLKNNNTGCGLLLTSFGNTYFVGAKIEDSVLIGKRLKLLMNAGQVTGKDQSAYGGSIETTLRGRDYPVRDDKISLAMSLLSFKNEMVIGGNVQSDFRVGRGTKMSLNANLNNRSLGQVSIKCSTSEHSELALIAAVTLVRAIFRRWKFDDPDVTYEPEDL